MVFAKHQHETATARVLSFKNKCDFASGLMTWLCQFPSKNDASNSFVVVQSLSHVRLYRGVDLKLQEDVRSGPTSQVEL